MAVPRIPPLPTECLEGIVTNVSDRGTLFSLLTVNRAFFNLAVRSLYRSPFEWVGQDNDFKKYARMLRFALQLSRTKDDDTERLRRLWDIPDASSSPPPVADYFSHVRVLLGQPLYRDDAIYSQNVVDTLTQDYFEGERVKALRNLQKTILWMLFEPNVERLQRVTIPIWDIDRYEQVIPRMDRIEEIRFDVNTEYLDNADTLTLGYHERAINFTKQLLAHRSKSSPSSPSTSSCTLHLPASSSPSTSLPCPCTNTQRRLAISFIHCASATVETEKKIRLAQVELFKHMPPLHCPQSLNEQNWLQFTAQPLETDLSQVKTFMLTGRTLNWSDLQFTWPHVRPSSILERCRQLRSLHFFLPDTDDREQILAWAANEKDLALDQYDQEGENKSMPAHVQKQLVPVKTIGINFFSTGGIKVLQDAMYGFGHSLEDASFFNVSSKDHRGLEDGQEEEQQANDSQEERQLIGEDWDLPNLVDLTVYSNEILPLADQALSRAHKLRNLQLTDRVVSYAPQAPGWRRLPPWMGLKSLSFLELMGQIACEFHPASFQHMPNLETLTLRGTGQGRFCCSPSHRYYTLPRYPFSTADTLAPVSENPVTKTASTRFRPLHDSHLWTWDWFMPKLESLTLEGEPAYRFDPKWLLYCPNLVSLDLRASGHPRPLSLDAMRKDFEQGHYQRHVSRPQQDVGHDAAASPMLLSSSSSNGSSRDSSGTSGTPVGCSHTLTRLDMLGAFLISDSDLQWLLAFCTQLHELNIFRVKQFTLPGLLAACSGHPTLARVHTSRQVTRKDCRDFNLIRRPRSNYMGQLDRSLDPSSDAYHANVPGKVYLPEYLFHNNSFVVASSFAQGDEEEEMDEDKEQDEKEVEMAEDYSWLLVTSSDIFL